MQQTDFVSTLFDGYSNPDKVTVAFTMAMNAALKGHSATIILMAGAVELGKPNATSKINIGAPFQPVAELLSKYIELGGCIAVCSSCMVHNGFSQADMDERYQIISAADVVDLLMGAKGSLQVS
ncbi:DsrE family protein [Alcaligenaceae bacterium]|nr:DsrE family protein [Alcaligenaceae bacterium]